MANTNAEDIAFALQDMKEDEIFADKKFAQELELAEIAINWDLFPEEAETHSCSSRISEVDHLYEASKEDRLLFYNDVKQHYKDKLPLGGDRWLSGGNHFHIFFGTRDEVVSFRDFGGVITPDMYKFIKALPFYAKFKKFDDGTKKFFSRRAWGHRERSVIVSDKSSGICYKTQYASSANRGSVYDSTPASPNTVQSLEFRMNGTIDNRIYGLYQAAMLYAVDKSFGEVKHIKNATKIYNGITEQFDDTDCDSPGCISLDKLHNLGLGFPVTKKDTATLVKNTNIALSLLHKYGLVNSANSLQSYIDEYNILT